MQQRLRAAPRSEGRPGWFTPRLEMRRRKYAAGMAAAALETVERDRNERILDAVLRLLAAQGIAGVSMRAVAREAGVALGLVNYHFEDKHHLICAALRRVEALDISLVESDASLEPEARLRAALRRVAAAEYMHADYLMLRVQVWSLAHVHEDFAEINTVAHDHYREGLARLVKASRPHLSPAECRRRAVDIDLIQNGMWLSAFLGSDRPSIRRAVARTEEIALAP